MGTQLEQLVVFSAVFGSWRSHVHLLRINERELRRRRFDLEALAAMAVRLEDQSDSASVAHTLLAASWTLRLRRALFFTAKEGEEVKLLAHVGDVTGGVLGPPPDLGSVIHHTMATRSTQLVAAGRRGQTTSG